MSRGPRSYRRDAAVGHEVGRNADRVEYYTYDTHVMVMAAGAEVPLATARDALREYLRTGQRPTCVERVAA
ncbi:Imm1 family immunity protein [Saccharopolyspora sp. NPDC049426]|uniref:Imm1 family immunity protein n=1 Tax=Saccharopolyspora sp. NPDC049426 TaxID=3155652 RepID=UPI00343FEF31